MEDFLKTRPWMPKPFTIAVLDGDEQLADTLCEALNEGGYAATAFYDMDALLAAYDRQRFDAYVLDATTDWRPEAKSLEKLIESIRINDRSDAPVFMLGNQAEPERVEPLASILMQYKVNYLIRPLRTSYLVKHLGEAIAKRAGL